MTIKYISFDEMEELTIDLTPCACGHIGCGLYYKAEYYYHKCFKCGFASEPAKTTYEARQKWNECVERVKALEYITSDIDTLIDTRKE